MRRKYGIKFFPERILTIMKKEQYGKEINYSDSMGKGCYILRYYLTESDVSEDYSNMKCYGIEIDKIERNPGMRDIRECKLIDGVFFNMNEATEFLSKIKATRTEPIDLKTELEKYIFESVKKTRIEAAYKL